MMFLRLFRLSLFLSFFFFELCRSDLRSAHFLLLLQRLLRYSIVLVFLDVVNLSELSDYIQNVAMELTLLISSQFIVKLIISETRLFFLGKLRHLFARALAVRIGIGLRLSFLSLC